MTRLAVVVLSAMLAGCASVRQAAAEPTPGSPPPATQVVARAAAPAGERPDPAEVKALEKTLRDLLVKHAPDPLVQSAQNWGHQKECVVGVKFHKDGPRLRSERVKGMRNDGLWRRLSVRAVDPEKTLGVGITEAAFPEPGRATFTAMVGVDCALKFEQQLWQNGHRLYGGETRGRCRAAVLLKCEVHSRTETKPGSLIPDLVVRVRVTDAQLFYEKLVIDHTAGVDGELANRLGEAVIDTVKRVKPDLERDLLAKANAAIVKAADTKEVRVSFDAMLKGGAPAVSKGK